MPRESLRLLFFLFRMVAMSVAGSTISATAFALPAALLGDPNNGHGKQRRQHQQRNDSTN